MEKELTEVKIPFAGFYESIASDESRRNAFNTWPDCPENVCDESELDDAQSDAFNDYWCDNYKKFESELVDNYISNLLSTIKDNTNIDLSPAVNTIIDPPREYNFGTDRIFTKLDTSKLIELYNHVNQDIFADVVKDNFTSYDGFSSYYSNDGGSSHWSNPGEYDHNQWCAVLKAIMRQYNIEEYELYN